MITVTPDGDDGWAENFETVEDLEKDLRETATDEYREAVMKHIRDGETDFRMENDPGWEQYTVS